MGPQAFQGLPNGFVTQTPLGHPLFMADLRGQSECPHARGLAIGAWRLRQEMLETLTVGGVQYQGDTLGPRRLLGHARQALGIKGVEDVAYGLHSTAHQGCNGPGRLAPGTREDNLRPADTERIRGSALGFQLPTLLLGQWSYRER
jgi:hypothetical protein